MDLSLIKIPPDSIIFLSSVPQSALHWTLWPYLGRDFYVAFQMPEKIEQALVLQLPIHSREHIKFLKTLPDRETAPLDAATLAGEVTATKDFYIRLLDFRDRLWIEFRFIESKHRALKAAEPIKKAFRRMRYIYSLIARTSNAITYVEESFPQFSETLKKAFADRLNIYRWDHALRMVHPYLKPFVLKMPNYKTYDFIDLSTQRPRMMLFDAEYQYDLGAIRAKNATDAETLPPLPVNNNQYPPMYATSQALVPVGYNLTDDRRPAQNTFLTNLTFEDYWMPFILSEGQATAIQTQLPIWSSMHMRFSRTIPHKEFAPLSPTIQPANLRQIYVHIAHLRDLLWVETKIINALSRIPNSSIPFWKGQEMLWYAHYLIQRACQALVYMEEVAVGFPQVPVAVPQATTTDINAAAAGVPAETKAPAETSTPIEPKASAETKAPTETDAPTETKAPAETATPVETKAPAETGSSATTEPPATTEAPSQENQQQPMQPDVKTREIPKQVPEEKPRTLADDLKALQETRTTRYGPQHALILLQSLFVTSKVSMPDYEKKPTWVRKDGDGRWLFPINGEPEPDYTTESEVIVE